MSVNLNTKVFVLIGRKVFEAKIHQTCAYNVFMSHDKSKMQFTVGHDVDFQIKKQTQTCGFKSENYPNWCVFINAKGDEYIMSPDKVELDNWLSRAKRLTNLYGGNVTKRKRSRRNLKRKTIKRNSKRKSKK